MTHRRRTALLLLLVMVATACQPGQGTTGHSVTDDRSREDEETTQVQLIRDLAPGDAAAIAQSVNAFGFDLLGQLDAGEANTVTSPLSIATMLAMVLAGAGGDTARAMADVLHLEDPRDVRVGALLDQLIDTDDVTIEVANALWADPDTPFLPDYLRFAQTTFDATLEQADLGSQAAADDIDAWVSEHTDDVIDGIAADLGLPDPLAVLVLLNAVYFLGEWTTQFDPDATRPEAFSSADGTTVEVPMMTLHRQRFGVAVGTTDGGEGYRMLRLPYGQDGRYAMEVLLPDGDLAAMVEGLDAQGWSATVDALVPTMLAQVALPRFELQWSADLGSQLIAMGMGEVFGPDADLSAMTPAGAHLDSVVHKTYIRVDERGTEAAAVTGGGLRSVSLVEPTVFRVDRPFAFTISDAQTGAILFLGTVTDPRG